MDKNTTVCILGARGLVGSSIERLLRKQGFHTLLTPKHSELDLCNQSDVNAYFAEHQINQLYICAGRVGGIIANSRHPYEFLYENAMIAMNCIQAALKNQVGKTLYLGSSCIYPKFAEQPLCEEALLSGGLETTNEGYALAKITGIKLAEYAQKQFGARIVSAMPCNLYGPGDNYHPNNSHVIPGLMRRFHEAKVSGADSVTIWGSGKPLREFLFADDLSRALLLIMEKYESPQFINVGSEHEITIRDLSRAIATAVDFRGSVFFDPSKPDGTPRKIMNSHKIKKLGWSAETSLEEGLKLAYAWALENHCFESKAEL